MDKQDVVVKMSLSLVENTADAILNAFEREAKSQGFNRKYIAEIVDEAISGDHANLVEVIMSHIC